MLLTWSSNKHLETFAYKVAFTESRKIDVLMVLLRIEYASYIKNCVCEQGRKIREKNWSVIKTRRI